MKKVMAYPHPDDTLTLPETEQSLFVQIATMRIKTILIMKNMTPHVKIQPYSIKLHIA